MPPENAPAQIIPECGTFTLDDFEETHDLACQQLGIRYSVPVRVAFAFGTTLYDENTNWEGGFIYAAERLHEGLYDLCYLDVRGWCDNTGWGCQDGVHAYMYMPEQNALYPDDLRPLVWGQPFPARPWSPDRRMFEGKSDVTMPSWVVREPIDLNRYCVASQPDDLDIRALHATPSLLTARRVARECIAKAGSE